MLTLDASRIWKFFKVIGLKAKRAAKTISAQQSHHSSQLISNIITTFPTDGWFCLWVSSLKAVPIGLFFRCISFRPNNSFLLGTTTLARGGNKCLEWHRSTCGPLPRCTCIRNRRERDGSVDGVRLTGPGH